MNQTVRLVSPNFKRKRISLPLGEFKDPRDDLIHKQIELKFTKHIPSRDYPEKLAKTAAEWGCFSHKGAKPSLANALNTCRQSPRYRQQIFEQLRTPPAGTVRELQVTKVPNKVK
jgi:hypothetical protein